MLTALVAVAFFKASLTAAGVSNGGKLLACIYPTIEKVTITCSTDGSSLIALDEIQATRLEQGDQTCSQQKARNVMPLSGCTYQLNNSMFYYQFQYPKCNLKPSCIINGDLPSAIVILGFDNCTADDTGRERDAVIISWSCVATDMPISNLLVITTAAQPTASLNGTVDRSAEPQSNISDKTKIGVIVGCVVFAAVASATVTLLLLARHGRLPGWTAAVKRHCCFRGAIGFPVHSDRATQIQPAVLVIDKRGNLSSAPQASISKKEKDSMKHAVQHKSSKRETDNSQPSDMEVEVDTNDDYQKFSSDLLDICEEEPPAAEQTDNAVDVGAPAVRVGQLEAKPHRLSERLRSAEKNDLAVLAETDDPAKAVVSANGFDSTKLERKDKKSRRRQYEMKWNARYQDTTETETDDRRPPPLPPPYVLDPDPQAYQLPWLPSPADSSDE